MAKQEHSEPKTMDPGLDTPTGTDPDAKYEEPGYQDKSFGQAVQQDRELADDISETTDDSDEAERRFAEESAGAPVLDEQG